MSSFCPAEQKVMCQGSKDPAENKEMPLPGLGGSWENLSLKHADFTGFLSHAIFSTHKLKEFQLRI